MFYLILQYGKTGQGRTTNIHVQILSNSTCLRFHGWARIQDKQFTNDDNESLQPILFYLQPRLIQRSRFASSAGLPLSPPADRTQCQEGPGPSPARVTSLVAPGAPEGGSALSTRPQRPPAGPGAAGILKMSHQFYPGNGFYYLPMCTKNLML